MRAGPRHGPHKREGVVGPENNNISTHTLKKSADCDCGKETRYCPICDGGLAYCTVCKGGERELIEESCQERCRRLAVAPVMAD